VTIKVQIGNLFLQQVIEMIVCVRPSGVTALHLAAQRGNVDAVRCLLSAGADVDIVDTKYHRTALYYAMQRNDVATADLLLSYGANPTLVPYTRGSTPTAHPSYSSSKLSTCSIDLLQRRQPVVNYRQPPACCPTGDYSILVMFRIDVVAFKRRSVFVLSVRITCGICYVRILSQSSGRK